MGASGSDCVSPRLPCEVGVVHLTPGAVLSAVSSYSRGAPSLLLGDAGKILGQACPRGPHAQPPASRCPVTQGPDRVSEDRHVLGDWPRPRGVTRSRGDKDRGEAPQGWSGWRGAPARRPLVRVTGPRGEGASGNRPSSDGQRAERLVAEEASVMAWAQAWGLPRGCSPCGGAGGGRGRG